MKYNTNVSFTWCEPIEVSCPLVLPCRTNTVTMPAILCGRRHSVTHNRFIYLDQMMHAAGASGKPDRSGTLCPPLPSSSMSASDADGAEVE